MSKEKKLQILNKIKSWSLLLLFISVILEIFFPIFQWGNVIFTITFYFGIVYGHYLSTGKINLIQLILCIGCVIWVVARIYTSSPYLNIFGQVIVYCFLLWSSKQSMGVWNKRLIVVMIASLSTSLLGTLITWKGMSWILLLMQFAVVFYYLDPILERIALEHRATRLAKEAEESNRQKEAADTI